MPIFSIQDKKLKPIKTASILKERHIQEITELNLQTIFGLTFISGSLNQEFSVKSEEQDFYIDTLAFDEESKSFVIIEYKKDRSFSVIDQGFAYLSAMLNHKADFVLELNERLNRNYSKKNISWEEARIIFVSPVFTNYQRNAINFKDLPIYLYEVTVYENQIIDFDPIKAYRTTVSISKISKDKIIQTVSKEIKVYTVEDLIKSGWSNSKELFEEFDKNIRQIGYDTRLKVTKVYIAYMSKHGRNYVEIVPQQGGIKVYYRFPAKSIKSTLKIEDISNKGHLANGISYVHVTDVSQIPEALRLAKESYQYLHRDILDKKKG